MCGSEQDGQLGKTGTWAGTQMHTAEEMSSLEGWGRRCVELRGTVSRVEKGHF